MSKHVWEKCRKWADGRTDGHHHTIIRPVWRRAYKNLSHLRAKYSKSPQKFLSIFTSRQLKWSLNVLIRSIYLSIMETTRWDLSNNMWFVLVYCCVGMLMTSCFGGSTPILGRKRITLLQPLGYCSGWTGQTKNVERP